MGEDKGRCRIITADGHQCSRKPVAGGVGFCWQHVPVTKLADREKWQERLQGAALAVATTDVVIK